MKRFMVVLLAAIFAVVSALPAFAARPEVKYPVTFNGHPVSFDVQPKVINGSTYVPFRAIFEKMGAEVKWDAATQTVTATRGGTTVKLTIGSANATVNGEAKSLPGAPFVEGGRTMVPLRFVGEAFGAEVSYNDATTAISIIDKNWPKRGGTLNFAMWSQPKGSFNPITNDDTYGSYVMGSMYDGLWRYDERFTPIPALAEAWEWDSTNTQLTFHLRKDVKFHDGTPLTAKDVVFTYKAIWHPKYVGPRNVGWESVLGWENYTTGKVGETAENFDKGFVTSSNLSGLYAVDDYTVVFKLSEPYAPFIFNVAYGIMDSSKYSKVPVQDFGRANDPYNLKPNGTGPFKMSEAATGQYYVLTANDNYWSGRPYVDRMIWRVVAAEVAVGEVQRGNIDFAEFAATELESYQAMKHISIHEFPDVVFQMMVYNTTKGPTADKTVRQALNYAINRQDIIHNLMKDHASTMYGPVHPLTWAYTDDINHYDFNPEKARQLLDQAGWILGRDGYRYKNGQKLSMRLTYSTSSNPVRMATAPVVQQMLKDVGVEIKLNGLDWPTANVQIFDDHDFDIYFIGFSLGNSDPDPTGLWDKASTVPGAYNASGWWTEKSEELIKKGVTTGDIEDRIDIYHEWAKHWVDESPAYIFYAVNTMLAANNRLQNFRPGPQGYLWNLEELWLSQ